jgi:hypothetical protein
MVAAGPNIGPIVNAPIDPLRNLAAAKNEVSTDDKYLEHEFITYSGWMEWTRGYNAPEAREAVDFHLRGWPYQSASLARHCLRLAYIQGALARRTGPTLRTLWRQESTRGPGYARRALDRVWDLYMRDALEEKLRDKALLGGSVLHIHWVDDVERGERRPVLKRWPHESMYWRAEAPGWPGGWYAITTDSGLVRMNFGDGKWVVIAHGERWHEFGAILSVGELFVPGKLSERDEAGLSEAAGRASILGELPDGVKVADEIGLAYQKMIAGLGRARTAAVVAKGGDARPVQVVSDTQFFDRYSTRQLIKIGYAILGIPAPGPGATSQYTPIVGWSVDEALVEKDHEALIRGWERVARPYCEINAIDSDVHLAGERYASQNDRAKAEAERSTLLATTVEAWRKAGLEPEQEHVDALAKRLSTPTIPLGLGIELSDQLVSAMLKGGEGREKLLGLPAFGDERDEEVLAHLLKAGPTGAMPVPGETATPQAPIPVPGPNNAAPPGESDPPEPPPDGQQNGGAGQRPVMPEDKQDPPTV